MRRVFKQLLDSRNRINPTRGPATELTGVLLEITNPRARISRTEKRGKLFSCLGELLWYLAGKKDLKFIAHYVSHYRDESEDGKTVYGGYGPRLFNMGGINQIGNVVNLLKNNPYSRRAVIQLIEAKDIATRHKEIPCTCMFQFMIRQGRLHMLTTMRSNDAFLGLSHDVFAFTMLQEILARALSVELGTYKHMVGSLHLYEPDRTSARQYLKEGWQSSKISMPPMPLSEPWDSIGRVLKAERSIRLYGTVDIDSLCLDDYWSDLVRLLQIYRCHRDHDSRKIAEMKKKLSVQLYDTYIDEKRRIAIK